MGNSFYQSEPNHNEICCAARKIILTYGVSQKGWWCYPTPSDRWRREGTPRRPNSRATPQGLDQRSKIEEVVPKMARWGVPEVAHHGVIAIFH